MAPVALQTEIQGRLVDSWKKGGFVPLLGLRLVLKLRFEQVVKTFAGFYILLAYSLSKCGDLLRNAEAVRFELTIPCGMPSFYLSTFGGEGGIRTLEGCNTLLAFQASALDHYATPPRQKYSAQLF